MERSLRASLGQKLLPLKVILIDQNEVPLMLSEDITGSQLFERQYTNIKAVSGARNSLKIPAETDWIFFCDDDGYPSSTYSNVMHEIIYSNKDLQILAGSIVREDTKDYYSLRHKKGGSLTKFRNTKNLMGSNFVINTNVFNEIGRFDPLFGAGAYWGSGEETDFCWKAWFAGIRMEYFKELIVYHVPPFNESIKTGFKKSFNYAVGKGALVWKWLFVKKKIIVLYELSEMVFVPFLQMLRGVITFKFQLTINNFAVLAGRFYGLIKAAFINASRHI